MRYIYRWNGEYFGFINENNFYNGNSNWIGWVEGKHVYQKDGELLGEIYEENYILKKTLLVSPVPRIPHIPYFSTIMPAVPANRIGRVPLSGLEDALEGL